MTLLARSSIERPWRTLLIGLLFILAAAPGLLRLELRTDGRALVPGAAPEVLYDQEMRERFGVRDRIVVMIETDHPDGIFNPSTLRRVRDLTTALLRIDGVGPADLLSLATELTFPFRSGRFQKRTFLEDLPETPDELEQLRDDLRRIELYDGTLVGRDGRSTAILIGVPEGHRPALYRKIRKIASQHASSSDAIGVIGAPVAEALLGNHILADLGVPASLLHTYGDGWDRDRRAEFPRSVAELRSLVGRSIGLVPIAIAVMGLVFLASFRRVVAALLPLVEVGCCLAIVFGVMGWLGVPIYLTTAILPVILTAVGVADEIHIFRRVVELYRERPEVGAAEHVRAALEELTSPVVRTSLTTAIGFLSFALSPLVPVRMLGLFAAFGVVVCMLWSLSVIPALLVLLPSTWWARQPTHGGGVDRWRQLCVGLARVALRWRWVVLASAALVAGFALDGIRRVTVQDSWIDGFEPASAFAQATRRFEDQFLGSHVLLVVAELEIGRLEGEIEGENLSDHEQTLEAPPVLVPRHLEGSWFRISRREEPADDQLPAAQSAAERFRRAHSYWPSLIETARREGDRLFITTPRGDGSPRSWLRPEVGERFAWEIRSQPLIDPAILERVRALESFLGERPGVGGVLGPARFLATAAFMLEPEREGSRRIPDRPHLVRVRWSSYGLIRGKEHLHQLVFPDYSRALITVFLQGSNYLDTRRLMAEVRAFERVHLAPHGIALGFGGDVAVSQALIDAVITTQVRSVFLALLGILTVATLFGRSLRWGLLCVLPPAFAVLLDFALMGWSGVPLGVATSMFAGMTLGIGVDFSIHLLTRYQRARAMGTEGTTALVDALAVTGPAILIDALAVGLGFSVLLFSQVPANARLGGLLGASVLGCVAATLLIVPALLTCRSLSR